MSLIDYVSRNAAALKQQADDWEAAVRQAGRLLEQKGTITPAYTDAMVEMIKTLGPYIVVMPGVALAHARPEGSVLQNSIAVMTFQKGVAFGNESNDPVYILFAIAACTNDEHLELFQAVAEFISEEENVKRLMDAETFDEIGFS